MSQQINLLRLKGRSISVAVWPLAAAAVVLLGLLGYVQSMVGATSRLRDVANAGEQKLAKVKDAIQVLQKQKEARGNAAALSAEIAALRPRAEAVSQVIKDIRGGSLGNSGGYARYLTAAASVSEDGVWITGIGVSKGGSVVSISGRALRNESVMQYARRLNESFSPFGVRFNTLELTPENVSAPATSTTPGTAVPMTVAFKLS
jgi:Tfp pilus assembly protein PilN